MPPVNNLPTPDFSFDADAAGACIAGVRPYRRGSYRLEPETRSGKFVVHNYGHGGAGITLSWGCAARVRDIVRDHIATSRDNEVAVVILPSWIEHGVMRERPDGATAHFYRHLADGSIGFRLGGEFRTRFWTQALYTWGDPMLDTHWETAIAGYKVFVRTGDEP